MSFLAEGQASFQHYPAGTGSQAVVQLEGVTKTYGTRSGDVYALAETSLGVSQGEFVSIVGPSGCGKSTLLNIISGLLPPSGGRVEVLRMPVSGPVTELGIVFQQHLLLPWRSVLDNVLLQVEARKLARKAYLSRARELLKRVGLEGFEYKLPRELSGGMSQRVSICRALIHDPPLLLMDEPFGALDAMTRDQMNLDFQALSDKEGKTVIFVTHSITEAVFLSDRVIIMTPRPGRIDSTIKVQLDRPRSLAVRETPEYTRHVRMIRERFQRMGLLREREGT